MTTASMGLGPTRPLRLLGWRAAAGSGQAGPAAPIAAAPAPAARMPWLRQVARSQAARDAAAVRVLQQALKDAGFDPGPVDGWFGPRTAAAVRLLQRSRGLVVDGQVGPHTWGVLGRQGIPRPEGVPRLQPPPTRPPGAPPPAEEAPGPAPPPAAPPAESRPGFDTTPGTLPPGHPHERRREWFTSQLRGKYNPNEDAVKNGNCGPTSVTMIARAFGKITYDAAGANDAIEETRRRMGVPHDRPELERGTSFAALLRGLRSYGLEPRRILHVASTNPIKRELEKGNLVLAHLKGHYLVVTHVANGKVYVNDPASRLGPTVMSVEKFLAAFQGTILSVRNPGV